MVHFVGSRRTHRAVRHAGDLLELPSARRARQSALLERPAQAAGRQAGTVTTAFATAVSAVNVAASAPAPKGGLQRAPLQMGACAAERGRREGVPSGTCTCASLAQAMSCSGRTPRNHGHGAPIWGCASPHCVGSW